LVPEASGQGGGQLTSYHRRLTPTPNIDSYPIHLSVLLGEAPTMAARVGYEASRLSVQLDITLLTT